MTVTYVVVSVFFSPGISSPINFFFNSASHMRCLSVLMLSKKTVLILPPTSVLLASLSAQGSHVSGLHS